MDSEMDKVRADLKRLRALLVRATDKQTRAGGTGRKHHANGRATASRRGRVWMNDGMRKRTAAG